MRSWLGDLFWEGIVYAGLTFEFKGSWISQIDVNDLKEHIPPIHTEKRRRARVIGIAIAWMAGSDAPRRPENSHPVVLRNVQFG